MKRGIIFFLKFLTTVLGIFMIGSLPLLFFKNVDAVAMVLRLMDNGVIENGDYLYANTTFNLHGYISGMSNTFLDLFHLGDISFYEIGSDKPLFPTLLTDYLYSMKVLFSALIIGVLIASLMTFFIMYLPKKWRSGIQSLLTIIQSIPDILVVLLLQMLLITIFVKTGKLFLNTIASYHQPAYGLPILCLCLLPIVFLVKYLVQLFEDEEELPYVELAKAKGLNRAAILYRHIFKNTLIGFFSHFKSIFWFTLSNLLMIEVIFDIQGVTWFVWRYAPANPEITTIAMLMIFIPFFIIFSIIKILLNRSGVAAYDAEVF